jgi:hypothetical protein
MTNKELISNLTTLLEQNNSINDTVNILDILDGMAIIGCNYASTAYNYLIVEGIRKEDEKINKLINKSINNNNNKDIVFMSEPHN